MVPKKKVRPKNSFEEIVAKSNDIQEKQAIFCLVTIRNLFNMESRSTGARGYTDLFLFRLKTKCAKQISGKTIDLTIF